MSASDRGLLLLAIALVCGLGWLAVSLGFVPSPMAGTVVRFRAGKVSMKRGALRGQVREDLAEVLSSAGVADGFIAISGQHRIRFSRTIPEKIHQRLRNVLLN